MRIVAIILFVLGCLLNQVAYRALAADGDGNCAHVTAAHQTATDVLLRTSDNARLPKIAEGLLAAYVVPQVAAASFERAADSPDRQDGELRPTLQSLDVRLQV